ncbi:MAG: hypothetical protein IKB50_00740 [Clostridia bacterium]|nr:hypothetical protein [Clostridia bacterium]
MKKIFTIALCICLMLSVAVVSAEEVVTGEMPQFSGENMPRRGQFNPENMPQVERPQMPQNGEPAENPQPVQPVTPAENTQNPQTPPEGNSQGGGQFGMQPPRGGAPWEQQQQQQPTETQPMTFYGFLTTYATPITSVVLLGLAFVFVIFYKRKNY